MTTAMILNLLALFIILAIGAAGGVLAAKARFEHRRAEQEADEEALAETQELYAAWAEMRRHSAHGDQEPDDPDCPG